MPQIYICPQCEVKTPEERCPTCDKPTVKASAMQAKVAPDPFVGKVIADKYIIEGRIGKGGMGSVYKARHKETDGIVAVKLIRTDRLEDENHIRRFYIEAQNTHQLHHPNTIRCSDFGQTEDGVLYLVMEYIAGHPLKEVLKKEKRLAPSRVVRIAEQILKSLGEAHGHQVVHRDIKPDNIMLLDQFGEKDFVKVLDFGVSRSLESTGASTQGAIGTPKYMSPEQWSGQKVDGRADLYALGGVMYHMIAGRLPFVSEAKGAEQLMAYMNAHLKLDPIPLRQLVPGACPEALSEFVMRLLAKSPDHRPMDAGAALEELNDIRSNADLADTTQPIHTDELAAGLDSETMSMMPGELGKLSDMANDTGDSVAGRTDDTLGTQANDMPDGTTIRSERKTHPWVYAAAALVVAGIAFFALRGEDTPAPVEPSAAEVAAQSEAEAARVEAAAAQAVAKALEAKASPGKLVVHSAPTGALCKTVSGEVLGTTPLTLTAEEVERVGVIVLSAAGHREARTAKLAAPGADETLDEKITLAKLPEITFTSTPDAASVKVEGVEKALGTTPFDWSMPAEVADRLEKGESIRFVFDKPGFRITTFALTQGDVKADGRAYVKKGLEPKLQKAPGPTRGPRARTYRSKHKQPAPAAAAPKPAPKKPAKKPAKKRTFTWD